MIYLQRNELEIELNLMKYSKFSDYQINARDRVFVKHNLIVNRINYCGIALVALISNIR
jgi:hypothetical protein